MTKPNQAIELVSNVDDTNDLLLGGIDGIQYANYDFSSAHYTGAIGDQNSVSNVFGLGEDNKFFYTLLSFRDNEIVRYESGVGYGYEKDGKQYFCRYLPAYEGKHPQQQQLVSKKKNTYICDKGAVNVLMSSYPANYSYLFHDSNCIISSIDTSTPYPVHVKEHSFLARLNDNNLASVPFDSKAFSEIVAESLTKYNKQLSLKASKLNANKLSVKQLQLEPTSDLNVKKGTFIYDEESDTVKFFNGIRWRTLAWVEDEE